jgi:hypothetical protein
MPTKRGPGASRDSPRRVHQPLLSAVRVVARLLAGLLLGLRLLLARLSTGEAVGVDGDAERPRDRHAPATACAPRQRARPPVHGVFSTHAAYDLGARRAVSQRPLIPPRPQACMSRSTMTLTVSDRGGTNLLQHEKHRRSARNAEVRAPALYRKKYEANRLAHLTAALRPAWFCPAGRSHQQAQARTGVPRRQPRGVVPPAMTLDDHGLRDLAVIILAGELARADTAAAGCMKPPQVWHSPATQVAPGSHAEPQQGLPTAPQLTHAPALQTPSCPQGVPFG